MTSFTISTAVDTGQTLVNGESGVVTSTGAIDGFTTGTAIAMSGTVRITIDGLVAGDTYGIASSGNTTARVTVGTNGTISGDTGVSSTSSASFSVTNHGTISGASIGLSSSTDFFGDLLAGHNFTLTNTGTISSLSGTAVFASTGDGITRINNSGTILGDTAAIRIEALNSSAINTITNSGTIQAMGPDGDALFVLQGTTTLTNTGTVIGDVVIAGTGSTTKVTNSGTISGDVSISGSATGAALTNTGTINGNVGGTDYKDVFRLSGGTVTGSVMGGQGNDDYFVNNTGLILSEALNGGVDTVYSSVTWTLGANFEYLTLTGNAAIDGFGNNLDNDITGNNASNVLRGRGGNDVLYGDGGEDSLVGGAGNDIYFYDEEDSYAEGAEGGTDRLVLEFGSPDTTLVMANNIERFSTGGGTMNINVTGNASNNNITTADGNDTLNGTTGTDTLDGGSGSDLYITDGGDILIETDGIDTVQSSVSFSLGGGFENLTLTGSTAITANGNDLSNRLIGNSASNNIDGKLGADTMTGAGGNDNFIFSTTLGINNVDTITDFNVAADTIRIDNAVFTGLAAGALAAGAFLANTTGKAAAADDRIIYETDTGNLFFDRDGTGGAAAVQFATVSTGLALTSADFIVF